MRFTHFPPIVILIIGAALVAGGFEWGSLATNRAIKSNQSSQTGAQSVQSNQVNRSLFEEAWNKLHERALTVPDDVKLTEGAISGLTAAIGDPYTVYLNPEAAKDLEDGLQGTLSGIGAEVGVKDRRLLIVSPLPDSPAEKAGLKPQDEIQMIDDQPVGDLTFVEAVRKIRGDEGTKVKLIIVRVGMTDPFEVEVTRGKITIKSVESEIRPDGIGYLKITAFHNDTNDLSKKALDEFLKRPVKGIILDLRGNPGGLLNQGVSVASLFLSSGVVVKQRGKDSVEKIFEVNQTALASKLPLMVLVNKGSASASEILAGALQDAGRAVIIGEQTFGKGTVQELIDLQNGGQLKVTVAEWLTPKDRLINGTGITPDQIIVLPDEDEAAGRDPQLDAAVKQLTAQ